MECSATAEQSTVNRQVVGSNPTTPAKKRGLDERKRNVRGVYTRL